MFGLGRFRWERSFDGEPLMLAIETALSSAHEGLRSDENVARLANKIVRRELDKSAIAYADYRTWRKRNPLIFTPILDGSDNLLGFFDIFPLGQDAGEQIISGKLSERSLRQEHILPFEMISSATHLHLATILVNPRQKSASCIVAREVLILKLKEFLDANYAPASDKVYTAFAQSKAGETFLRRCEFSVESFPEENEQRLPLYVLRPKQSARAVFRISQAEKRFRFEHHRSEEIKVIDLQIETVELRLRALICTTLCGDATRVPEHVNQKLQERIRTALKKDPSLDRRSFKLLERRLEFCDLRELEDTLACKQLWKEFEPRFGSREALQGRFARLADLRNAIRHSRTVDEVVKKEGEAAIIWFDRVLQKPADDLTFEVG
jgi:hypothetical protein